MMALATRRGVKCESRASEGVTEVCNNMQALNSHHISCRLPVRAHLTARSPVSCRPCARPARNSLPQPSCSHSRSPVSTAAAAEAVATDEEPEIAQEKLRIKLKAYSKYLLAEAVDMILDAARSTGAKVGGAASLPTRRRIYCVLTSPHVNKNAREHFEIRTHKRIIDVRDLPQATIEKLFSLEIPAGVQVRVSV